MTSSAFGLERCQQALGESCQGRTEEKKEEEKKEDRLKTSYKIRGALAKSFFFFEYLF